MVINGSQVETTEGKTVLQALKEAGVKVPSACDYMGHENGVCRLCMVQIDGSSKLVPSCFTKVHDGMQIVTESQRVKDYRRSLLRLLMNNHGIHHDSGEAKCDLHHFAREHHVLETPKAGPGPIDTSHPAIDFDPSLCIECGRCIIACNTEQNNDVIATLGKGPTLRLIFGYGEPLGSSTCVSCGACVDACPTGALIEKNWEPADRTVVTTCPYCGVGCQVEYGIRGNNIIWAKGFSENSPNEGKLCVKGKFGYGFEMSKDRLLHPLIRRPGAERTPLAGRKLEEVFRRASWDEAISLVSSRITSVKKKYGPSALAGIASDRSTNEDVYALQKLMRAVLGSDNVDQSATLCHAPSASMLSWGLGAGASTNPMRDVLNSKTILVVGSNTDRAHPVVSSFVKKAARQGAKLVVVDPRRVELAKLADKFLQLKPGTDTFLFSAMAKYIIDNGLYDSKYVREESEGFDEFVESLKPFDLVRAEGITGIPRETIGAVAKLYATNKPSCIFWTLGVTEHSNGSDNVSSLVNLAILTGNIGIPGSGLNPIRGQNNVQGGADVGGVAGSLPGYQDFLNPLVRKKFEDQWHVPLPETKGWKSTEMMEKALEGSVKLMYISGENSARSHPNSKEVERALGSLDFLVVQDIFMTETAELADVVLPAASAFEQWGTFTNTERRVQMVRPLFDPPGEAKADWKIYSEVAESLGYDLGFADPSGIMDEITKLVPTWKGISHSRLQNGGMQWPVPSEDSHGTTILHAEHAIRGKARLRPLAWNRGEEDKEYPYVLITGRKREQYHTGTMTARSSIISKITQGPYLEMSPEDMKEEGIEEGNLAEAESSSGRITCRIRSSDNLPRGVTFTTFHFREIPANVLTPDVLDPFTKTPAYKDTRIRVRKIQTQQ